MTTRRGRPVKTRSSGTSERQTTHTADGEGDEPEPDGTVTARSAGGWRRVRPSDPLARSERGARREDQAANLHRDEGRAGRRYGGQGPSPDGQSGRSDEGGGGRCDPHNAHRLWASGVLCTACRTWWSGTDSERAEPAPFARCRPSPLCAAGASNGPVGARPSADGNA